MREKLRNSGIDIIGDVPWGTHICQFYQTKEDLMEILVTYFKAGLENNEFCLWVTSHPVEVEDAKEALSRAIPDFNTYLEKGQIEIIPYSDWFTSEGIFDPKRVLNSRLEKLNHALDNGYDGMRLSGNTTWLEKENWGSFIEFKEQTDKTMDTYRLVNLCTYFLDRHSAAEIIDIVVNHQFALIKREGKWKRIESYKRKQAEEALRESEEKYRNFIETAIEGILIVDPEARITYSNEKMAEMLGYTQDEMLGRFAWDFADHEDKSIIKLNLEKRRQGINEIYELKLIHKDGSLFWGLVSAKPLFDKAGKFTGSMAMLTDITKRKEAETRLKETLDNLENLVKERTVELEMAYKSLKESEKGLAEAQKMAHIGNWEWDIASDKAYWSEGMYRIFKRDPQKLAPSLDEYLSYIHPDDVEYYCKVNDYTRKVRASGLDFRIVLANGEERTLHIKSDFIYNDENIPIRVKGIVQDITEREKAKQELELSEERYRIITEQTGQLVYDYDPEKNTADWAGNVEELTGFTPEEFRSMSLKFWFSRIHPEDLSTYLEIYDKYMKSGDAYRTEYRFRKKDGEYIYIEDNGVCLRDKKSNVHRILGVIKNITERKKAEIFLANIENVRKKEIHHRIKNNLQVISSLLDLQAEKFRGKGCVEDSEVLKAFRESQDRVMSIALIHEELHEGRETNKLNITPYLERLVKNLFQTYWLGNAGTSLNIELEENIFFDMDIAVPLGIVINELISNSLKYAFPGGGKGLIEIKLLREESVQYTDNRSVSKREDNVTCFVLTVSDNGVGIPEDFNLNTSETLGLQLVTILVDQLGGKLELKRNPGTKFIIKFGIPENK